MAVEQFNQRVEIELLKKDVSIITSLCEKFDTTIDKMQEIASNLSRMVSLQEQRMELQEKQTNEMQNTIEMRRIEHNNDIKELHSRITTVNRELSDKIEETERTILAELHLMREELKKKEEDTDTSFKSRLAKLESWQYMLMGGIAVIVWVLARSDLSAIFKLIFR